MPAQNKTRKFDGRRYQLIAGYKFATKADADNYAKTKLNLVDYKTTKTGPTTYRLYEPLESKESIIPEPVIPAKKPGRKPTKRKTSGKQTTVITPEIVVPANKDELSAINITLKELNANITKLIACFAPIVATQIPIQEQIQEPIKPVVKLQKTPEPVEAPETEPIETYSQEPVCEETEAIINAPKEEITIIKRILKALKAVLNPLQPDASWMTIADISLEVSKRPGVVFEAASVLQESGCVTVEGEGKEAKVKLTEKGWNSNI